MKKTQFSGKQYRSPQLQNYIKAFSLLLKAKNFHFTNGEILVPLKKCGSILTGRTLVRVIQADTAVVRIWSTDNTKVMATSKCGPIPIVTVDCLLLFSSYQW